MSDVKNQLLDFMRSHGVVPRDPSEIFAGDICRFALVDDKPNKKSGWIKYHDDGIPNATFKDWRQTFMDPIKWVGTKENDKPLSESERQELKQKHAEHQRLANEERARVYAETAAKCKELWSISRPASADHPYLVAKGLTQKYNIKQLRENLVIPVYKDGEICSLQFISKDLQKKFKSGSTTKCGLHLIGQKPTEIAYICEGWATGASIHDATGKPVVVAFNAENLTPVAQYVRKKYPDLKLVICADDDRFSKGNAGIEAATKAASAVQGELRRPVFPTDDGKPTDFNDLALTCGVEEVRHQLERSKPSFEVAETPKAIAQKISYDLMSPFPHCNSSGKPLGTIENVIELLDRLGVIIRYDVIKKKIQTIIPGESFSVDNIENATLARVKSWATLARIPVGGIEEYLNYIADKNQYNPAVTWIKSKPWDGNSRFQEFLNTVETTGDNALKETLMRKWMISAVAAAFLPGGVSAHGVLVFQGAQYLGKTKWFINLVPEELGITATGQLLNPSDKDSVTRVVSNWLVELGELDSTFKKSEISQLKAFITQKTDVIRRPFDRRESNYGRRTVFFGSVNPDRFLADQTGNRRYWSIACSHLNYDHGLDMQQVWAEVYETMFAKGETWYLSGDEMEKLNASNNDFEMLDPIEEKLVATFDWTSTNPSLWRQISVSDALCECGIDRPTSAELAKAGLFIKKLNGGRSNGRTGSSRFQWVAPRRVEFSHPTSVVGRNW